MRFWFPVWLYLASVLFGFSGAGAGSTSNTTEPLPLPENKGGSVRALTDLEGYVTDTFTYDSYGVSQVGPDSGAVRGVKLVGKAPGSLAPQAGLLRDASGSHVGYYAPLESPLQFPLLASIPLRETDLLQLSSFNLHTSYLYRGERYDPDLGQYYLRARFYDANLGRFHTLDEYEGRTGEPLSLHKYLYAHGNPVSGWDPSGRMTLGGMMQTVVTIGRTAGMAAPRTSTVKMVLRETGCYVLEKALDQVVMEGIYILDTPYVGSSRGQPSKGNQNIDHRIRQHIGTKIKSLNNTVLKIITPKGFSPQQIRLAEQLVMDELGQKTPLTHNKRAAAGKGTISKLSKAGKLFKFC